MSSRTNRSQGQCPKCGEEMEEGFILDRGHNDNSRVSKWIEGDPVQSFWHGPLIRSDQAQYEVTSYRCAGCGYLESYANKVKE